MPKAVIDNAKMLAEVLLAGGGRLISGGTDNHLMLLDVTPLGLAGKQAEAVLGACGITVNKNMIPYDERKPLDPSGIRLGTAGPDDARHGAHEMKAIGGWILQALKAPATSALHTEIHSEVFSMCEQFPVPAAALGDGE